MKPGERLRARLAEGGVALIVNANAKRVRRGRIDPAQLRALVELYGQCYEPATLTELDQVSAEIRSRDPGLIAICGGDGTYQKTLTSLLRAYGTHPLPVLLPLAGGTFNALNTNLGIRGDAVKTLASAMSRIRGPKRGGRVVDLAEARRGLARTRSRPILQLTEERSGRREWGFIFAGGVIARVIMRYAEGPSSVAHAARAFSEAVGGFMMRTPASKELVKRHAADVTIDGRPFEHGGILGTVIGTIQPQILGFSPFVHRGHLRDKLCYALAALDASEAIKTLPALVRGRGWNRHPGLRNATAREIRMAMDEGWILDGDVYPSGVPRELTISVGPRLRFLRP